MPIGFPVKDGNLTFINFAAGPKFVEIGEKVNVDVPIIIVGEAEAEAVAAERRHPHVIERDGLVCAREVGARVELRATWVEDWNKTYNYRQ